MKNFTLYAIASILLGILILIPQYANAQVLKLGSCPSGWSSSGQYCVAGRNADPIVPKIGAGLCPSGWRSSGQYCVAGLSAKGIMMKVGSCPSGWRSSGNYCVKH